jgi:hypothetical protein
MVPQADSGLLRFARHDGENAKGLRDDLAQPFLFACDPGYALRAPGMTP